MGQRQPTAMRGPGGQGKGEGPRASRGGGAGQKMSAKELAAEGGTPVKQAHRLLRWLGDPISIVEFALLHFPPRVRCRPPWPFPARPRPRLDGNTSRLGGGHQTL